MSLILLTGYGGFLGQAIAKQLVAAGHRVRGLARKCYPELQAVGVEAIEGDVCDRQVVFDACQGCDAIIHTAAKAGVWGAWDDYHRVNTQATIQLIEIAKSTGVQALVLTSSPSVTFAGEHQSGIDESVSYPKKWLCNYPATKALAEQAVLQAARSGELRACALRPHLIWGNGDPHLFPRVVLRAQQRRLKRVGDGKNLIDVVHVDNAARAHLLALSKLLGGDQRVNGEAFFLTDGEPIECWEWISRILHTANVPVPASCISYPMAYRIGAFLEAVYHIARKRDEPPMTRFVAAQLALDHYFSIQKARELLDYNPEVDREAELAKCKEWLADYASYLNCQAGLPARSV